jgi:cytochrome c553
MQAAPDPGAACACEHDAVRGRLNIRAPFRSMAALAAVAGVALAGGQAFGADAAAGREKVQVCQTCHGIDGVGKLPNVPNIAGESEIYLLKQLKAFRSGERKDEQMSIIAEALTDEDIADLAAWYASIKFTVQMPE